MLITVKRGINSESIQVFCKFIASLSWMTSILVLNSYDAANSLQLIAASAWTISNLFSCQNLAKTKL